jgi:HD-like signal output (HDOD) protein
MSTTPNTRSLKELLQGAQLPALPQSAIKLLELSQDPNNGPAEFAAPIEADPGLCSQVLKFVNSSYFGFSREISNVKLAITLVGIRTIKNFSLWSAVFSLMPNPKCGPFDLKKLWHDSLRRGLFARACGKTLGMKDAEDLFAASLLHDLAIPLLSKELPTQYTKLLEGRAGGKHRLSTLEQAEFGWDHAQAAGVIARAWSLPEEFSRLIEGHTQLDKLLAESSKDIGLLSVSLSANLPTATDNEWLDGPAFVAAFEKLAAGKGKTLAEVFAAVDKDFAEFAPMLKLQACGKSLVQNLEALSAAATA